MKMHVILHEIRFIPNLKNSAFFFKKSWYTILHKKEGESMESYQLNRHFLCIDLKSFYASVECAQLGLDPFKAPLVVADQGRGGGSIVLAVSPYLKNLGVPSRCRIYDLPSDQHIIYRKPQMRTYLEYAAQIIGIYLRFVSEDDLHIYSIDEVFLDVTSYLNYYGLDDQGLAKKILATVLEETKIYATCGIGPNMLIAKLALDLESKKSPDYIAKWHYKDIKEKLWSVEPLSKMWGIGHRMEKHLNVLGLTKIGDIANYDVKALKKRFGILGEELYYHTHGIDMSLISQKKNYFSKSKSYGVGQMLFRDYHIPEIYIIIREMVDEICGRLRRSRKFARTVSLGIVYTKSVGGGFSRQITLDQPSASETIIYKACLELFKIHAENEPIRRVHVSVTNLVDRLFQQLSIFENDVNLNKETTLFEAIDDVRKTYGKNSINRASSELEASTIKARNKMVGGHNA
jgi:DNA polymerase V